MARASTAGVRVSGLLLLIIAAGLAGAGAWLVHLALGWPMPTWLPQDLRLAPQGAPQPLAALRETPLGLAAGYVSLFAGLAGLNGLWMLVLGRRNWLLVGLLIVMFLVFVAVGLWAGLDDRPWTGWVG